MNRDNAKDYLPLVQAMAEGKLIQFNKNTESEPKWIDVDQFFDSNPVQCYRIKPEPKEIWVNEYPNGRRVPWNTEVDALENAMVEGITVHYREVIE